MKAVEVANGFLTGIKGLKAAGYGRRVILRNANACLTVIALGSGGKVRAEAKALLKKLEARNADQA